MRIRLHLAQSEELLQIQIEETRADGVAPLLAEGLHFGAVDPGTADKFHRENPARAIFYVGAWNMKARIVFEQVVKRLQETEFTRVIDFLIKHFADFGENLIKARAARD